MPPSSNDDHVVAFLGLGFAPGAIPSGMVAQGFAGNCKGRVAFHEARIPQL